MPKEAVDAMAEMREKDEQGHDVMGEGGDGPPGNTHIGPDVAREEPQTEREARRAAGAQGLLELLTAGNVKEEWLLEEENMLMEMRRAIYTVLEERRQEAEDWLRRLARRKRWSRN